MVKKWVRHLVVILMLVSLILVINGKAYFNSDTNLFLYVYGITVTTVIFFTFLLANTRYKDPSEEIRKKGLNKNLDKPLVSCVFAVRNEEKFVGKCIDSLLNSTYKKMEIIVINDASTDNTQKVLDEYEMYKNVIIINLKNNIGKKRAIAEGLKIAKGKIYVFTDSDSVVAPDAIERIIEIFVHDPKVGAVSGHGRALNSDENLITKVQDSWYETQFSIKKALESSYGAVTCVSGPLAVFRKEAIYNYIPAWQNDTFLGQEFKFATDRQLTGYVLGSRYIGPKLKKKYKNSPFVKGVNYPTKEWKVLYCKSAKVWTIVPNTFKKVARQQIRWKKSFIRNLFFTGTFYWRKPIVPALKYYLGAFFTIVGPFIAFRHLVYLPLSGNLLSAVFYLSGILFIGSLYAVAFKLENPKSKIWVYRPLMSIFSTLVLSWLIVYSAATIKKMVWYRG
jgi:cellulose synthase/poly-beta-1,6-N-acetylglucosamine synthase-like glycosyltransferase